MKQKHFFSACIQKCWQYARAHKIMSTIAVGACIAGGYFLVQHFRARGMVCEVEHPTAGKLTHYGIAPKFSRTPARIRTPAPLLGQDNAEVYGKWLGYNEAELEELRREGVI